MYGSVGIFAEYENLYGIFKIAQYAICKIKENLKRISSEKIMKCRYYCAYEKSKGKEFYRRYYLKLIKGILKNVIRNRLVSLCYSIKKNLLFNG